MLEKFVNLPSHKQIRYLLFFFITTLFSVVAFLYRKVEKTKLDADKRIEILISTHKAEIKAKDNEIKRLNDYHISFIEKQIVEREEMKRNIDSLKMLKR